jgi:hypothetical protein
MPAGNSIKNLERKKAETTKPTRTPEGSKLLANIGRKDEDKLIPIIILNPIKRS